MLTVSTEKRKGDQKIDGLLRDVIYERPLNVAKVGCERILQAEESPVVVVNVDVGRSVDEEHDPGLQPAVEVAKAGHGLVRKVHLVLMSCTILKSNNRIRITIGI